MKDEILVNYFINRLLGAVDTKNICGKCGVIDNDVLNYISKNSEKNNKRNKGIKESEE